MVNKKYRTRSKSAKTAIKNKTRKKGGAKKKQRGRPRIAPELEPTYEPEIESEQDTLSNNIKDELAKHSLDEFITKSLLEKGEYQKMLEDYQKMIIDKMTTEMSEMTKYLIEELTPQVLNSKNPKKIGIGRLMNKIETEYPFDEYISHKIHELYHYDKRNEYYEMIAGILYEKSNEDLSFEEILKKVHLLSGKTLRDTLFETPKDIGTEIYKKISFPSGTESGEYKTIIDRITGTCQNPHSVHFRKDCKEAALDILNQSGWNEQRLNGWIRGDSMGCKITD